MIILKCTLCTYPSVFYGPALPFVFSTIPIASSEFLVGCCHCPYRCLGVLSWINGHYVGKVLYCNTVYITLYYMLPSQLGTYGHIGKSALHASIILDLSIWTAFVMTFCTAIIAPMCRRAGVDTVTARRCDTGAFHLQC